MHESEHKPFDLDIDWLMFDWYPEFVKEREAKRREILFRKFSVRKCSNHRKHQLIPTYIELSFYVPFKKIHKAMQKLDRQFDAINPLQVLKRNRIMKKYTSLLKKLTLLTGKGNV